MLYKFSLPIYFLTYLNSATWRQLPWSAENLDPFC